MVDATARYVLTAHDQSRAGVESFRRNLRLIDSQVRLSNRGFGGMLGTLGRFGPAGIVLTAAFMGVRKAINEYREVIEATAKAHPELADAMKKVAEVQATGSNNVEQLTEAYRQQAETLENPSYKAARTAFADWLLSVKARAVDASRHLGDLVGKIRESGVAAGIFDPRNDDEMRAAREARRGRLESERALIVSSRASDPLSKERLAEIERQLERLQAVANVEAALRDFSLGAMAAPRLEIFTQEEVKAAQEMAKFLEDIHEGINEVSRETSEGMQRGLKDFVSDEVEAVRTQNEIYRDAWQERMDLAEEERAARLRANQEWSENTKVVIGSLKDAVGDMINTGKFAWRDFIKFMIAELAKRELFDAIDAIGDAFTNRKRAGGGGSGGGIGGFFRSLLGFQHGTNFVPQTAPYILHKGEAVIPARENQAGGRGVTFSPTYYIDAKGADAERVLAVVPIAMERTHERAVGTFLQIMRRNGFRLT